MTKKEILNTLGVSQREKEMRPWEQACKFWPQLGYFTPTGLF